MIMETGEQGIMVFVCRSKAERRKSEMIFFFSVVSPSPMTMPNCAAVCVSEGDDKKRQHSIVNMLSKSIGSSLTANTGCGPRRHSYCYQTGPVGSVRSHAEFKEEVDHIKYPSELQVLLLHGTSVRTHSLMQAENVRPNRAHPSTVPSPVPTPFSQTS